ncbi:MAG TPA: hypothetical protein VM841_12815 [Actinomycetota bacterium]|nr:hypothetical protein [Actinomycetota bacterium]
MRSSLDRITAEVRTLVDRVATVPSSDVAGVLDAFERLSRVVAAGRLAALAAVERSRTWRGEGHASFAHWAAERTGTTVGHALGAVTAAKTLASLPATREALASGTLSVQQASEIAGAAAVDPASEPGLLGAAAESSASELRERCRMVKVAAAGNDAYERIRRTRYLRFQSDPDDAVRVEGRLVPDAAAALMMWCRAEADRRAAIGRRDGTIEPHEALMADALCSLPGTVSSGSAPRAKDAIVRSTVYVHVDAAAWERGSASPGERCEIAGVGPTTVAAARRLAAQPGGTLKIAIRDKGNVVGVVNTGRYVPARVGAALEVRDERCVVKGCTRRRGLQRDHIVEYGRGGETSLANLQRVCGYHHDLKTHMGWKIVGEPPNCRIEPPAPP